MNDSARARRLELLEVVTVGLPFCGFKILSGLSFARAALPGAAPLAAALVVLGAVDAVLNLLNLAGLAFAGRRPIDACAFSLATRPLRRPPRAPEAWKDFGNSLDVLLSFTLVAVMIGGGRLTGLSAAQLATWNVCVILNVLGAGLGRFGESLRNLRAPAA